MQANPPPAEVEAEVRDIIRSAREAVEAFDPDLIVLFAPDHFNAFFYEIMPPFCIGVAGTEPHRISQENSQ
jgi:2,3-dihydroxyphenylpropionate 1,2-dioxygenase